MNRFSILAAACTCAFAVGGTSVSQAASVHFKGTPTFADQGMTLRSTGALAGLGNKDVTITLSAVGHAETRCANPAGHEAPGQNPADVVVTGAQSIPATAVKNGTVAFDVATVTPATTVTPEAAGCPNGQWTARIVGLSFDDATLRVDQGGATVLEKVFPV